MRRFRLLPGILSVLVALALLAGCRSALPGETGSGSSEPLPPGTAEKGGETGTVERGDREGGCAEGQGHATTEAVDADDRGVGGRPDDCGVGGVQRKEGIGEAEGVTHVVQSN